MHAFFNLLTCVVIVFVLALPAHAQGTPPGDLRIGAGVSFLRGGGTATGFSVDFAKPLRSAPTVDIGAVGEVALHRDSASEDILGEEYSATFSTLTLLGGARVTATQLDRVQPFGQVLFGIIRAAAGIDDEGCEVIEQLGGDCSASDGSAILGFGGGVDVPLNERWNLRAAFSVLRPFEAGAKWFDQIVIGVSTDLGR